jgi:hypothetical protein
MAEFASKGVAGSGLGLGIAGTALGVLNGGLGNVLGGLGMGMNRNCSCNEDHMVNRYEASQQARIAELETEVKLRDANTYTDQKMLEMYQHFDRKIGCIEGQLSSQAVYNATNTAQLGCMAQQIAALNGLTKMVIPTSSICPEVMPLYNSWTAPTTTTTGA